MKNQVGIWIDHEQAIVVSLVDGLCSVTCVKSNVEGHHKWSGRLHGAKSESPQGVTREKTVEERRRQHLHRYYGELVDRIRGASHIFIFGPGEAKLEFEKEIRKSKELGRRVAAVETADKMPETRITAKVRAFYEELQERQSHPRRGEG